MSAGVAGAAGARRLFPHYAEDELDLRHSRSLILSRLLEDGDSADLAWLTNAFQRNIVDPLLPQRAIAGLALKGRINRAR